MAEEESTMVVDDEAGREVQGDGAQVRRKMPRLTNEGGDGSTGAASSSSSGAQGALALTTSSGGIPSGEMGPSPSTLLLGPGTGQAIQPFGVLASGMQSLAVDQWIQHLVSGSSGAPRTLLSPQSIGSPVDQSQDMSPSPDGIERGRICKNRNKMVL